MQHLWHADQENFSHTARNALLSALPKALKPGLLPKRIDFCFDVLGHGDDIGPTPREALFRPFPCRIDAHFGTVVGKAAGMVEGIEQMCLFAYLQKSDDAF